MTAEEELFEVEWYLKHGRNLTFGERDKLEERRKFLKEKKTRFPSNIEEPFDTQACTPEMRTVPESLSLHELLMLQKELNYRKRQVSKQIRKLIQPKEAQPAKVK